VRSVVGSVWRKLATASSSDQAATAAKPRSLARPNSASSLSAYQCKSWRLVTIARLLRLDAAAVADEVDASPLAREQPSNVLHQLRDVVDKLRKLICGPRAMERLLGVTPSGRQAAQSPFFKLALRRDVALACLTRWLWASTDANLGK